MARGSAIVLILLVCLSVCGCASAYKAFAPPGLQGMPKQQIALRTPTATPEEVQALANAYYETPLNDPGRTSLRNQIIFARLSTDDRSFSDFEWALWSANSSGSTLGDAAVLSLTGLGSVYTKIAPVLAAAAAGVTGFQSSVEKNFMYNQTMSALLISIETNRTAFRSHIVNCLAQPDAAYPLDAALYDEQQYQETAVLPSAIARLAAVSAGAPAPPASCGIGANSAASLRTALMTQVDSMTSADVANLQAAMTDVGLKVSAPSADQTAELRADVDQITQWMVTASDSSVSQFDVALSNRTSASVVRSQTITTVGAYTAQNVGKLETAMKNIGIVPATPGNLSSDQSQINAWIARSSDADVGKLFSALGTAS